MVASLLQIIPVLMPLKCVQLLDIANTVFDHDCLASFHILKIFKMTTRNYFF